jgi:SAM-dependent methyltransferase
MSEPQYAELWDHDRLELGRMSSHTYATDAKRLGFTLARYKFVARVLAGCDWVLEVGCGDAWATRVVAQAVGYVVATDFDAAFIDEARSMKPPANILLRQHDMRTGPQYPPDRLPKHFDAAFALDVLEHIPPNREGQFLGNIAASVGPRGSFVCGMPSLESQSHASELSKAGHVNCKTEDQLRSTLKRFFTNVFVFGMNDETLHTGFGPMCHYRLAVCAGANT